MDRVPLDEATVERLLAGPIGLEDAPQGLVGVAALFRAAAGAAIPAELIHEEEVVASGIAVLSAATASGITATASGATPATDPFQSSGRRNHGRSKLLTARVAAITTAAALGLGAAAAAATGSLPGQDSGSSNPPPTTTTVQASGSHGTSHTASTSQNSVPPNSTSPNSTSPGSQGHGSKSTPPATFQMTGPANDQSLVGLCTAFLAGDKSDSTSVSPREANAFRYLIAEHGGTVTGAAAFCRTVVKTPNATEHNRSQNAPNTNDNGQPSGTGKGSGSGNHSSAGTQSSAGSSSSRGQSSNAQSGGSTSAGSDNGVTTATTSGHGHSLVTEITGQR